MADTSKYTTLFETWKRVSAKRDDLARFSATNLTQLSASVSSKISSVLQSAGVVLDKVRDVLLDAGINLESDDGVGEWPFIIWGLAALAVSGVTAYGIYKGAPLADKALDDLQLSLELKEKELDAANSSGKMDLYLTKGASSSVASPAGAKGFSLGVLAMLGIGIYFLTSKKGVI